MLSRYGKPPQRVLEIYAVRDLPGVTLMKADETVHVS